MVEQPVAARDRQVEVAEGDLLRHVLGTDYFQRQPRDIRDRAGDAFVRAVAFDPQASALQGGDGVLLLVAVGERHPDDIIPIRCSLDRPS